VRALTGYSQQTRNQIEYRIDSVRALTGYSQQTRNQIEYRIDSVRALTIYSQQTRNHNPLRFSLSITLNSFDSLIEVTTLESDM